MRQIIAGLILSLLAAAAAAGDAVLDEMRLRGKNARLCWIVGEDAENVRWRQTPDAPQESVTRRSDVTGIVYAFQRQSGAWTQGMEARERGKFAESADWFEQLAAGSRESEQILGSLQAGASWELAGKPKEAAAAFAKVADKFPAHPLAYDARYRLGMVLTMDKDDKEALGKADAVAKKLEEESKGRAGNTAGVRAAAIRAAIALVQGKDNDRRNAMAKAFSPKTDRESWLHFNLFMADALRAAGKGKDAVQIYERMLPALADDPAAASRVRLGVGLGKIDGDRLGAILDLTALDALPFGSPEDKCEARFHAGKLLWEEAQRMQKDPASAADERKQAFAADNLATARLLLQAAAGATIEHPAKAQAAELLKSLPPEKGEEAKPDAAEAAEAAVPGDKPAEAAKPDAKPAAAPAPAKPAAGNPAMP